MTITAYPHPLYKSLAAALLFTVFLGPVGLLYTSVYAGIFMLLLSFIVLSFHALVVFALVWIGCSIWSVHSTNRYNLELLEKTLTPYEEKNLTSTGT